MSSARQSLGTVVSLLSAFLAACVIAGFLAAGLFMPAVGAVGASARAGVDLFESLPDEFTTSPLSEQSVILAADGAKIATPYDENRIIVPLAEIAPIMRKAQVAIEDHRYYEHGGADLQGIVRALISNQAAGETQGGGSTLTQQYVKITLQYNALRAGDKQAAKEAVAQNYARKIQELKYAIALERNLTKDQILEGYLNLVYYGDRAYGVEAASQHYFSHSAKQMTLSEAALLAGLTQNPGVSDPVNYPQKALQRRNVVLDRMHSLGLITDKEWTDAKAIPLKDMLKIQPAKSSCAASPWPYFCDYVINYLKLEPTLNDALGTTEAARMQALYRGGLTIQTTMDPKVMASTQQQLVEKVPIGSQTNDGNYVGSAAAILDVKTGGVRAIAQNTTYAIKPAKPEETSVNWAVDTKYGASVGFGFGSTAKAFALVAALEAGMPVSGSVYTKAGSSGSPASYTNKELTGQCGLGREPWEVRNVEAVGEGNLSLAEATAKSVNTAFVGLVIGVLGGDACKVREAQTRVGLLQSNGEPLKPYPAAIILGSDSVSPMTVANSYQTIANDGKYCPAQPIISITKNKQPLPVPALGSRCQQRVDPNVARGVTELLTNVLEGRSSNAKNALAGGRVAAGKSGTTNANNETWFVGYTPELSTAVWVGTPLDKNNSADTNNLRLGGRYIGTLFSSVVAGPTWKAIMDAALVGMPKTPFPAPSETILTGEPVPIPDVARRSISDGQALLAQAGFVPQVVKVYSGYKVGTVVGTNPTKTAIRGSVVKLLVSQGPQPEAPPADPAAPPGAPPAAPPPPG